MLKVMFAVSFMVIGTIFFFVIGLTLIAAVQDKDRVTIKYDCRMLMGNWHPDVPKVVIEECKKRIKQ